MSSAGSVSKAYTTKDSFSRANISRHAESIHIRVHTLEEKLQEILESTRLAAQASASASASSESFGSASAAEKHSWNFDPVQPSLYYGASDGDPFLPPLEVRFRT